MNRRRFLIGLGSTLATPAIVRAASLDALPRGVPVRWIINSTPTAHSVLMILEEEQRKLRQAFYAGVCWGSLDIAAIAEVKHTAGKLVMNRIETMEFYRGT